MQIKASRSWHYRFLSKLPDMFKVPQIRIIFLQYVEKKVLQLLLCSIVMQNIRVFYVGSIHVRCYLLSLVDNH